MNEVHDKDHNFLRIEPCIERRSLVIHLYILDNPNLYTSISRRLPILFHYIIPCEACETRPLDS